MRLLACLWLLLGSLYAQDPAAILQRAIEQRPENERRAAQYLYQEDILGFDLKPDGSRLRTDWQTYEAIILGEEIYYKLVGQNGYPLTPEQQETEDRKLQAEALFRSKTPLEHRWKERRKLQQQRYAARLVDMQESHDLEYLREEEMYGRKAWVIRGTPRKDTGSARYPFEMMKVARCTLWIDQETAAVLRRDLEVLDNWRDFNKGSLSTLETVQVDGVTLPKRLTQHLAARRGGIARLREQRYSNYRKFGSEVRIEMSEDQPEN